MKEKYIFLSYSRREASIAREVRYLLESAGFRVWMDESDIESGGNWKQQINRAIGKSEILVVLLSEAALESKVIELEVRTALDAGIGVLPMIIHGDTTTALPDYLADIDLVANNDQPLHSRVDELIEILKKKPTVSRSLSQKTKILLYLTVGISIILLIIAVPLLFQIQQLSQELEQTHPSLSLISARYMSGDFNPRFVDLRTSGTQGIPARSGVSFQFDDVWVWSDMGSSNYSVQAEVYTMGSAEPIGFSGDTPLKQGALSIGAIAPVSAFANSSNPVAWLMQDEWSVLNIVLVLYEDGEPVDKWSFPITVNEDSKSWLYDTPQARIVSLSYSVNDGERTVLDLRTADSLGIDLSEGDTLMLHEVWYHADVDSDSTVEINGYTTANGYNPETETETTLGNVQAGINGTDEFEPLTWIVEPTDARWILTLYRTNDSLTDVELRGTLLDRLVIPINTD